jgi:hypothetical protein
MKIDIDLLTRFEKNLLPHDLSRSPIPVKVIGFGEISAIFQIGADKAIVYKRIPIFPDLPTAHAYKQMYFAYCSLLKQAGINLAEDDAAIIEIPGRPVVIYFAQQRFEDQFFCHNLINSLDETGRNEMINQIMTELTRIWNFNTHKRPDIEIAVDGQLSNWVRISEDGKHKFFLVDTSTPFIRKNGEEQLDVELLLQSCPVFIRWLVRRLDLEDVIGRYYDHQKVVTDLIANLYKEQRPDLIPSFLEIVNQYIDAPLTPKEIETYYKEDKRIWTLFSALRKADRFIRINLLKKRYEFILPGKVSR